MNALYGLAKIRASAFRFVKFSFNCKLKIAAVLNFKMTVYLTEITLNILYTTLFRSKH